MKTYLPTFLLLLGLIAVAAGCSNAEEAATEEATAGDAARVEVLALNPQPFEDVVELTGTVEALDDVTLSAQAGGTIELIADLGTPVEQGAVLARLDDDEAQAAVAQAKAGVETARSQLSLAQDNYNRLQPLYEDSVISASEFENTRSQLQQAKARLAQAEAQLASAQKRLENTRLRAPFSGTVEEKFFELGEQVSPGQRVVRVTDVTPAKITAGVPERYSGDVERGTEVTARFSALGGVTRTGKITFVGSTIDPDSRTFPIEINIENADRQLKPEMVAQLMLTRAIIEGALVVPRAAVIRDEQGQHVYTAERVSAADSTAFVAREHDVTIGPTYAERAVVETGLTAGDAVLVSGQSDVAPGDTVNVTRRYQNIPPSLEETQPPA
jgi:RND family efflux transporter MFP subunit